MTTTFSKRDIRTPYIKWVARAVADKKSNRGPIMSIGVKDGWACGTDGRRLHAANIGDVPDGNYDLAKMGQDIVLVPNKDHDHFPNWRQVLVGRAIESSLEVPYNIDDAWDELGHSFVISMSKACGGVFSLSYMRDAASIPGGVNWVTAGDGCGPAMFEQFGNEKEVFAVSIIMPIRVA